MIWNNDGRLSGEPEDIGVNSQFSVGGELALPGIAGEHVGVISFGTNLFIHQSPGNGGVWDTFPGTGAGNFT